MERTKNAHPTRQSLNAHKSLDLMRIVARHQANVVVASTGLFAVILPMVFGITDLTTTIVIGYGGILIGAGISGVFNRD